MYESRYFQALPFIPYCVEKNPQTLYRKYFTSDPESGVPFDITNSGIDTTEKTMQFYWLLRTLTITVTLVKIGVETTTHTRTTTLEYRRSTLDEPYWVTAEPYERVCHSDIGWYDLIDPIEVQLGSIPRPFELGDEIALHHDGILLKVPDYGDPLTTVFEPYSLALTTHNEDYGYEEPLFPFFIYVDQTIPITFGSEDTIGPFTLYVKWVRDSTASDILQLTEAVVDDFTYYTIKKR